MLIAFVQAVIFLSDPKADFNGKPLDSDVVVVVTSVYEAASKLNIRPILQLTKVKSSKANKIVLEKLKDDVPKFRWPRSHLRANPPAAKAGANDADVDY